MAMEYGDCRQCERLNAEFDPLNRAYLAALKTFQDNADGDSRQYLLLMAMVNEAKIEMNLARVELLQHQDSHALPN